MTKAAQIQNTILTTCQEITALMESLQKEFEFFASSEKQNEMLLKAKKRQIKSLEFIHDEFLEVFDQVSEPEPIKFATEPVFSLEDLREMAKQKKLIKKAA